MTGTLSTLVLVIIVFVPMLIEARRAAVNERAQRRRGGVQPDADVAVYRSMQVAYPGAFAAMIGEHLWNGASPTALAVAGAALFVASKGLKWWAILTLSTSWTFRVIVVPGEPLVGRGPYRFVRHPNYVAVAGELVGVGLMTSAAVSGPLAVVLFGVLLKRRISVEEKALASSTRHPPCSL